MGSRIMDFSTVMPFDRIEPNNALDTTRPGGPQMPKRRPDQAPAKMRGQQQSLAQDTMGAKRVPIGLGSGAKNGSVVMNDMIIILDIREVVLEHELRREEHQDRKESALAIERFEKETGSYEIAKNYVNATERYDQAMSMMRKAIGDEQDRLQMPKPQKPGKARASMRGQQQRPAHNIMSAKRVPILFGSGTKNEVIAVKNICEILPEELHQNEKVLAIEFLEKEAGSLAVAKKYLDAAECYEQAISLRRQFLEEGHPEFLLAVERLVSSCNVWGVQCLGAGQHPSSLELLKKAEAHLEGENMPNIARRIELRAATFNNLCCYFCTREKFHAALQFVEKAFKITMHYRDSENLPRAHLNYAVLLSIMIRHDEALEHLDSAIASLSNREYDLAQTRVFDRDEEGYDQESLDGQYQEVVFKLVSAHHNMFVEYSRLHSMQEANASLARAARVAKEKLGQGHVLTAKMEKCLASAPDVTKHPTMVKKSPPMGVLSVMDGDSYKEGPLVSDQLPALVTPISPFTLARPSKDQRASTRRLPPGRLKIGALRDGAQLKSTQAPGRPPEGAALPLRKSLKQLQVSEHIYGRAAHPIPQVRLVLKTRIPHDPKAPVPVGSARMEQSMHGSEPMTSVLAKRPPGKHGGQVSNAALAAGSLPSAGQGPIDPNIRAAYAFHMRQSQNPESWEEDVDFASVERIRAITALKGNYQGRTEQLKRNISTEMFRVNTSRGEMLKKIKAATKIQAYYRGFVTRRWSVADLANDTQRSDRLKKLSQRYPNHPAVKKMLTAPGYGPEDPKRKIAYRVVYNARYALVEYGAAVKIQKWWRGWSIRRSIKGEIARVAHGNATRLQAHFRRYRVACYMGHRIRPPKGLKIVPKSAPTIPPDNEHDP